eukprot:6826187-Prymnesium_polylepis.1
MVHVERSAGPFRPKKRPEAQKVAVFAVRGHFLSSVLSAPSVFVANTTLCCPPGASTHQHIPTRGLNRRAGRRPTGHGAANAHPQALGC